MVWYQPIYFKRIKINIYNVVFQLLFQYMMMLLMMMMMMYREECKEKTESLLVFDCLLFCFSGRLWLF